MSNCNCASLSKEYYAQTYKCASDDHECTCNEGLLTCRHVGPDHVCNCEHFFKDDYDVGKYHNRDMETQSLHCKASKHTVCTCQYSIFTCLYDGDHRCVCLCEDTSHYLEDEILYCKTSMHACNCGKRIISAKYTWIYESDNCKSKNNHRCICYLPREGDYGYKYEGSCRAETHDVPKSSSCQQTTDHTAVSLVNTRDDRHSGQMQ
jgi:hypothetical protein